MGYYLNKILRIHAKRMMKKYGVTGLAQESMTAEGKVLAINDRTSAIARQAAAQGCVLLKNDGVLPLKKEQKIAVFGRCQLDWFYVGYGSGGDVNPPYRVNFVQGLDNAGAAYDQELLAKYREWTAVKRHAADDGWWGHWPLFYPEMPVGKGLAEKAARAQSNERETTAVVIIGRAAGEDRENKLKRGSYYLTAAEMQMLKHVTAAFAKVVVVMNIGNIMDMSWTQRFGDKLSAILIAWQGGMESGNAVCDVLYGVENPSGRLPDTIAGRYEDYPSAANFGGKEFNRYEEGIFVGYRYFEKKAGDKVLFPFGFGLSYTGFELTDVTVSGDTFLSPERFYEKPERRLTVRVKVKNTGRLAGRDVIQLWCRLPGGRLEKPVKVLAAFARTNLISPGGTDEVTLCMHWHDIASYDEKISAFVLETGAYELFVADNHVPEQFEKPCAVIRTAEEIIQEKCEPLCASSEELRNRILERLPEDAPFTGDQGLRLCDVPAKCTLREFVQQLSDEELEALSRGQGMMNSPLGVAGNAGIFGGTIASLREKGIRPVVTSDGPAGLRLKTWCSLMPCGTLQAAIFDTEIVRELYECVGNEMVRLGVDVFLGPGMNIHRNPLCGRNFEYFSEDPVLSGNIAAAVVKGIQSAGKSACIKHFACNNQETMRNTNDSRVSERALRELYLRNFEICIRESGPKCLMTSYNKVNGVWAHYNYDLATTVLRRQWGFNGTVITDWWMQSSASPEFPELKDNAYRVRAQVDVLMPGDASHMASEYVSDGTLLATLGRKDGITRGELIRTAENVLRLVMYLDAGSGSTGADEGRPTELGALE